MRAAVPSQGPLEIDTCRDYVIPRLKAADWSDEQIIEQHYFTDGRVIPTGKRHRRKEGKRADYVLEVAPGVPVAIVEAKRLYKAPGDGLQQGMEYAEILDLPFGYSSNGKGIVEHDFDTGLERTLTAFPGPDELWTRYRAWKGITEDATAGALVLPFNRDLRNPDGTVKEPRYYQRIAIQRAVQAALSGEDRILITMATGTGKTFVALQVVWKLWESRWKGDRKPRVLYLADRNILVDQPIEREFRPVFGDAVWKVSGDRRTGREIYFALYQAIGDMGPSSGIFRDYPPDYFDLIVVDECHRGSARDESTWRGILEHFAPATQIGMTATPLRDDNRDTYRYFGNPMYEYSLAQGIDDGFLAPYIVHRVVLSPDATGWSPTPEQLDLFGKEIPDGLYTTEDFERVVSLLMRTRAAAQHLTNYLKATDRMDKSIVFCVDQEHAEQMRMELSNANADLVRQLPHYVARIVAAEGDIGRGHLDDFVDPERDTPVVATTSKLLATGVDVPTCRNIVLFRPIGSIVEFKQIIGRGTRLYPDQDKLFFRIIDYVGATRLFEDPGFDGLPEYITQEEIDDEGRTVEEQVVAEPEPTYETDEQEARLTPEELEGARARKYYVDEGEVFITAEALYILEPDGSGLRVVAYEEYVADQVRRVFPDVGELRRLWRTHDGRNEVVESLEKRGITFEELARRTGLVDADPFDLLVHVAWNGPLTSRRERANRLQREHADFLAEFAPEAREVLDGLLEKYSDHGIDQLDDLHILDVPPFPDFGTPVEIAERFGGADKLREAVDRLQGLLYAA